MTDRSTAVPGPSVVTATGDRVSGARDAVPPGTDTPFGDPIRQVGRFINRELSWLEFGARLLQLAADERLPLFERVKFLAIFSEGLDEFFQVRVAGLEDQVAAGLHTRSPDGMSPGEQLAAITERASALVAWQSGIFRDHLGPSLAEAGLVIADWHTLGPEDRAFLLDQFNRQIFPILTPLAVDQGHPFPYISNLSLNLVLRLDDPATGEERIARVKVPPVLPRLVALPDGRRYVPLEQVIAAHLDALFPGMMVTEHHAFRVTRNADLSVEEDEAGDLLAAVELELHRRRFGQAVRLEVSNAISTDLLDKLVTEVDVPEGNVYLFDVPIDLTGLRPLTELERPELAAPPWTPVTPPRLAGGSDVFTLLREGDILVHHPYESFAASVEAFVAQAAEDPDVLAIKQTLYRTGDDSPIVAALIRASRAGKQVTAVVELQARFDERANIAWARALEEAGVQVIYGLVSLKTHSKISLVVRREGDRIRRYCHVGTGNYNSVTARTYEDLGLLTAASDIGADVGELFNLLTGSGDPPTFRRLVVSPVSTRAFLLAAIEDETRGRGDGRIVLKTNGLTDPGIIDALYRASRAGASIDLIVRGRCCLRPGVRGLSETIRVRSIVGRYLEHSRIFRFGGVGGPTAPRPPGLTRPDGAQPRPAGRGGGAGRRPRHPAAGGRDPRRRTARSGQLVGAPTHRRVASAAPRRPPPRSLGFSLQDQFQRQALESLPRSPRRDPTRRRVPLRWIRRRPLCHPRPRLWRGSGRRRHLRDRRQPGGNGRPRSCPVGGSGRGDAVGTE